MVLNRIQNRTYDDYSLRIRSATALGELSALRLAIIMDKGINDEECLMLCQMLNYISNARATASCGGDLDVMDD